MTAQANPTPLEALINQIHGVQAFPESARTVLDVVKDPQSSLKNLEDAVALDPALTATMMKLANSPFYGVNRSVATLGRALMVLGFRQTRDITISLAMRSMGDVTAPHRDVLWRNATRVGCCCRQLSRFVKEIDPQTMLIAGLLHDFGTQLLLTIDESKYLSILQRSNANDPRLLIVEKRIFGADHAAVGGGVMRVWEFPEILCFAVENHHRVRALNTGDGNKKLEPAAIIALSDQIVSLHEQGIDGDVLVDRAASDPINQLLNLKPAQIEIALSVYEEDALMLESLVS